MATFYWVGGTGNWSDTNKWATTSGGASGFGPPSSADVAIIDANSGGPSIVDITIDSSTTITTLTLSSVDTLYRFQTAGNLTVTGTCAVSSTSATSGMSIFGNARFGSLTLTSGVLELNSSNITVNGVVSNTGTGVRTLGFGTGSITVSPSLTTATTVWSAATLTNCTITGSRTVNFIFAGSSFAATINNGATAGGSAATAIDIASVTDTITTHTVTMSGHFRDLNLSSFSKTLSNSTRTVYGNITLNGSMIMNSGTAVTTIAGNGSNKTITSNGAQPPFPITVALGASSEKVSLNDALTISALRTFTLTSGNLNLNGFTLTCAQFASTNSNTRNVDFSLNATSGTYGNIVIAGVTTSTYVGWSAGTLTGLTFTGPAEISVAINSSSASVVTIDHGSTAGTSASNRLSIVSFTAGTSLAAITTTGHFNRLNFSDPSGALRITTGTTTVYESLEIGSTTIVNASTSVMTLAGAATLKSNGVTLNFPITVLTGTTAKLLDACTLGNTRTFTLTSGSFDLNGFTLTTGIFASSGSTARTLNFNAGNIVINSSLSGATTVWSCATLTNFSYTGTWNVSYSVTGNFVTAIAHGPTGATVNNAYPALVNPTAAGSLTISGHYIDIDLSGISNTINTPGFTVYRDLKFSSTSPLTETISEINFVDDTYTKTLTLNGNLLRSNIAMNAANATLLLSDAFQSDKGITLKAGTFDANGFNVTTRSFTLGVTAGAKTLNMGSGLWTLNGSTSAVTGDVYTWIAWDVITNATNPSFTLNTSTSNILLLAFANTHNISFYGGGQTYNKVSMGGDFTGSVVTFFNDSVYNELESLKTVPFTLRFNNGTNNTINNWNVNGTASNQVTLTTRLAGVHTLTKTSGTVITNYLTISNSVAAGGATWRAPTNYGNVDGGGNSGWNFSPLVSAGVNSNFFVFF